MIDFNQDFYFQQVYSQYLDALCDFIVIHKVDLQDWLFVLLSRLLSKLGTDILSSLQSKIVRVLDVVRYCAEIHNFR